MGRPPWTGKASGKFSIPGLCLTVSSQTLPGRCVIAAERAFRHATSAVWGLAPSPRSSRSKRPASSTTAMVTPHFCLSASALAAAMILWASAMVSAVLLRIYGSFGTFDLVRALWAAEGGQFDRVLIGTRAGFEKKEPRLQIIVRDNNIDQALKALKKKMQREGIFREMKLRGHYEKPSEKRARERAEAIRRYRKLQRKRLQREGLLPR